MNIKKLQFALLAVALFVGAFSWRATPASAATATYGTLAESWFEGWSRLYIEFKYNPAKYTVNETSGVIGIVHKTTDTLTGIKYSFEGGRGWTPADYWSSEDAPCPECYKTINPAIKNVTNLTTYHDEGSGINYTLFNKNDYLFVVEYNPDDPAAVAMISSLTFTNPDASSRFGKIKVALLSNAETEDDPDCNYTGTLVSRPILKTTQVLAASMRELLKMPSTYSDGTGEYTNLFPKINLTFKSASVANKVAKVYFTGDWEGLEQRCAAEYLNAQIKTTALQFPTVKTVKIFFNGYQVN